MGIKYLYENLHMNIILTGKRNNYLKSRGSDYIVEVWSRAKILG